MAYPGLTTFPEVTLVSLVGVLLGLLPAVAAPEPRMATA